MRKPCLTLLLFLPGIVLAQEPGKTWTQELTAYRDIPFGAEFTEIVKQQGLIFTQLRFAPLGPKEETIAAPGQEETTAFSRVRGWMCSEAPIGSDSYFAKRNNRPARVPVRYCGRLKGGPFRGIADAPAVHERFQFRDDKLVLVMWTFDTQKQYQAVRTILVEKYGEPTSTTTRNVTNLNGAQLQDSTDAWTGKKVIVELSRSTGDLKAGSAMFASKSFAEELVRNSKDTKEKAKKAF